MAVFFMFTDFFFNFNMPPLAWPDIEVRNLSEDWDFLVLACDGIWDVLSNEDVCDFVRKEIAQGKYPEEICENMMTKCLAPDCQVKLPPSPCQPVCRQSTHLDNVFSDEWPWWRQYDRNSCLLPAQ